jgi:uncharacterized membrane protein
MNYTESMTQPGNSLSRREPRPNVGKPERIASTIAGGALIGYALKSRSTTGFLLGLLGASLVYRGATGQCEAYRKLGINTNTGNGSEEVARDVHVEKSITINRPPGELYTFWRNFDNLPRFMVNLESVTNLGGNRSRWVAKAPAGKRVEWDAEIYNEKENELIAWRSLPGSDVTNAGSVNFTKAPGDRGTYVKVTFNYNPPGGRPAVLLAKLFGLEPGQMVEQDLKRLKQLIETGVIPSIAGQSSARLEDAVSEGEPEAVRPASKTTEVNLTHEAKGGAL